MKRAAAKISLAIVLSLLTLEVGLQLASWVARTSQDARELEAADDDEYVILSVGDSHTWGAGVPRHRAYPAQLEKALRAARSDQRFRVMNLGVPGVNSSYVAKRLEGQIAQLRPRLVIVWVGANNLWNELEVDDDLDASDALHQALLHSKLYRLVTVLRHTQEDSYLQESEVDPQKAVRHEAYARWKREGRPTSKEQRELRLLTDMRRMVETTAAFEIPILFVTYPQAPEPPISNLIAHHAATLGADVVITSHDRRRAEADGLRKIQLFVISAGPHPTPTLYRYIVESMQPRVLDLIGLGEPRTARSRP